MVIREVFRTIHDISIAFYFSAMFVYRILKSLFLGFCGFYFVSVEEMTNVFEYSEPFAHVSVLHYPSSFARLLNAHQSSGFTMYPDPDIESASWTRLTIPQSLRITVVADICTQLPCSVAMRLSGEDS